MTSGINNNNNNKYYKDFKENSPSSNQGVTKTGGSLHCSQKLANEIYKHKHITPNWVALEGRLIRISGGTKAILSAVFRGFP
jgi:hypothetical protein